LWCEAETAAEQAEIMEAWGAWFASMVDAVMDGGKQGLAKGCPVLASGGTVDVYEAMEM